MDLPKDKAQELLESKSRRNFLKATGSLAAVVGIASGQTDSVEDGTLTGGSAMLEEAYQVGPRTWMGPDSAKATVEEKTGRKYEAIDTNVQYYAENGEWQGPLEIGSEDKSVPAVHTDDVGITNHAKGADFTIYVENGDSYDEAMHYGVNHNGEVEYEDADVHNLMNRAVSDHGQKLHFHLTSGNHWYDSTLECWAGMALTGDFVETTKITQKNGANVDARMLMGPADDDETFVLFSHLQYLGNPSNNSEGTLLVTDTSTGNFTKDVHHNHVFYQAAPEHGMHLQHTHGHRFVNSLVEYCKGDGIRFESGPVSLNQMHMVNVFIAGNEGRQINCVDNTSIVNHTWSNVNVTGASSPDGEPAVYFEGLGKGNDIDLLVQNSNGSGVEIARASGSKFDINAHSNDGWGIDISGAGNVNNNLIRAKGSSNGNGLYHTTAGARNIINGIGYTSGDPSAGDGQWAGYEDLAYYHGALVWDVSASPNNGYIVDEDGTWRQFV